MERLCNWCQQPYLAEVRYLNRGQGLYCCRSCSSKANAVLRAPKPNVTCAKCGKPFYRNESHQQQSKSGLYFCSRVCKDQGQRIGGIAEIQPPHYGTEIGIYTYRDHALRMYKHECTSCKWNGPISLLEVDHIDSNRENNRIDNLQILCVWCHAIKTRKVVGILESPGPSNPNYSLLHNG